MQRDRQALTFFGEWDCNRGIYVMECTPSGETRLIEHTIDGKNFVCPWQIVNCTCTIDNSIMGGCELMFQAEAGMYWAVEYSCCPFPGWSSYAHFYIPDTSTCDLVR